MADALTADQVIAVLMAHIDMCGVHNASADFDVSASTLRGILRGSVPLTAGIARKLGFVPQTLYLREIHVNSRALTPSENRIAAVLSFGDRVSVNQIRLAARLKSNEACRAHISSMRRKGAIIDTQHIEGYRFDGWR